MTLLSSHRAKLLVSAIVLIAGGLVWNLLNEKQEGLGFPTKGTVLSVKHDSVGCETWIPFAPKECRTIVKIRHRIEGAGADQSFLQASSSHFFQPSAPPEGSEVTGSCGPTGRCVFDQLAVRPYNLYLCLGCLAGAFLVLAWMFRHRRKA